MDYMDIMCGSSLLMLAHDTFGITRRYWMIFSEMHQEVVMLFSITSLKSQRINRVLFVLLMISLITITNVTVLYCSHTLVVHCQLVYFYMINVLNDCNEDYQNVEYLYGTDERVFEVIIYTDTQCILISLKSSPMNDESQYTSTDNNNLLIEQHHFYKRNQGLND
jgi:hypothetical protein